MPSKQARLTSIAAAFCNTTSGRWGKPVVRAFLRWMRARNLTLDTLAPTHLERFYEHESRRGLAESTLQRYRLWLHLWLYWLAQHGHLSFAVDPPPRRHLVEPLCALAERFLAEHDNRRLATTVRYFHAWLSRNNLALATLTPEHLDDFLRRPVEKLLLQSSRRALWLRTEPYLRWLHAGGHLDFSPVYAPRQSAPLPSSASAFIDTLRPVLKPSSCDSYVGDLRSFHAWLHAQNLSLEVFDRTAALRWLGALADRGLVPVRRRLRIFHVRRYLDWLVDKGALDVWPGDLLRVEDLPKVPVYLPRPFPVDADRELQRRFLACDSALGHALFLMRRSGVRIGELARLEPRCLERDLRGNSFLKVPLGKLDNERLVPLGDEARAGLELLQRQVDPGAEFLLLPALSRDELMARLSAALKLAATGLDIPGPVVSHRLRHSYATELLNAGLPLVTIMKLLGHRSIYMTIRYAAVAQQTIVDDYHAAVAKAAAQYDSPVAEPMVLGETAPERQTLDLISALRKSCDSPGPSKLRVEAIIKRLYKIRDDIAALQDCLPLA